MIENLMTIFYMLILLGIVVVINIILGTLIANKKKQFNLKKLLYGVLKAIIITLCILLFCLSLELLPSVLGRVGIKIPSELVSVVEIILTTLTAYKKYATDCYDKFKILLNVEGE